VEQCKNSGGLPRKLDLPGMRGLDFEPRLDLRNDVVR
jgi:hypothetical protein